MDSANLIIRRSGVKKTLAVFLSLAGFLAAGCSGAGDAVSPPEDVARAIPVPAEKTGEKAAEPPKAAGKVLPKGKGGPD